MRTDLAELKSFLESEFKRRSDFNSSYSKKAFARDLGISATALNEFLAAKRDLSFKNIDKIFKYLNSQIHCSWCCRPKDDLDVLVMGPRNQYICNECIGVCNQILAKHK